LSIIARRLSAWVPTDLKPAIARIVDRSDIAERYAKMLDDVIARDLN